MLTLTVVSDGDPKDSEVAVALAYNSGLAVKVLGPDGKEMGTVSAVAAKEEVPVVDEPHPVLEKEVPTPVVESTDAPVDAQ